MSRDWQSQLGAIKKDLRDPGSKVQGSSAAGPQETSATGLSDRRHSEPISRQDRAGRAPYNFVPLPNAPRWYKGPPPADAFDGELVSGYIDLDLKALTRFYIRGMRTVEEFKKDSQSERNGERSHHPLPFFAYNTRISIPGSSLRGMIRTLIEILGGSPLDPISGGHQLFFRAVAADDQPGNASFDPNAVAYKARLAAGRGTRAEPARPTARAGYLTASEGDWKITPAQSPEWYRVEEETLRKFNLPLTPNQRDPNPLKVWFKPSAEQEGEYHSHRGKYYRLRIVKQLSLKERPGYQHGCLLRSERGPGTKYMQWIIGEKDTSATPVTMTREDADAYLFDLRFAKPNIKYSNESKDQPCFYVRWHDFAGKEHVSIGHTGYFRLPYEKLVGMANPCARGEGEQRWDLAQAIFGRTKKSSGSDKREGARTRVFFEDAVGGGITPGPEIKVVLGSPKPTTYENYLVQESDRIEKAIHWDGQIEWDGKQSKATNPQKAVLRGWKGYLHRGDDAAFQEAGSDPRRRESVKAISKFCPAPKDIVLRGRVRFQNLDKAELGAILTALDLPRGHAHKVGFAKPLGFGSFEITPRLVLITRSDRYSGLFTRSEEGLRLRSGEAEGSPDEVLDFKTEFSRWALNDCDLKGDLWSRLEKGPGDDDEKRRLSELKALLRYGPPENRSWKEWQNATRYLVFDSFEFYREHANERPRQVHYNEYKQVGFDRNWPTGRTPGKWHPDPNDRRKAPIESRRPLPPASQVAAMGPEIPTDPRPPFGEYNFGARGISPREPDPDPRRGRR